MTKWYLNAVRQISKTLLIPLVACVGVMSACVPITGGPTSEGQAEPQDNPVIDEIFQNESEQAPNDVEPGDGLPTVPSIDEQPAPVVNPTASGVADPSNFTPPIGIPDPVWGQNLHPVTTKAPDRPADWTDPVDGFYYVDPSVSNATDANNAFGTPNNPRESVPSEVMPGAYVELHGTYSGDHQITYDCTEVAPCWVRGESAENMPTHSGNIAVVDSTYVFIENVNFDGGTGGAVGIVGSSKNVVVRNSRVTNRTQPNGNSTGVAIRPAKGETIENIVVYGNHFEDLGDWTVTEDLDFHAVGPNLWDRDSSTELRNVYILENFCTHLSGDCVQINAGNWADSYKYLHHIYVGRNTSIQNRQAGVGVKQASDVVISENVISGNHGNGAANAGGGIGYQYDKHNLWILNNTLFDNVYGIRQSDTGTGVKGNDVYIMGNLIYDIKPAATNTSYDPKDAWHEGTAIALWHGTLDRYVVDNTIFDVMDGVTSIYDGGVDMSGNLIANIDDNQYSFMFDVNHSARNGNFTLDHNLFFDDTGVRAHTWTPGAVEFPTSLAEIQAGPGQGCGNCLVGDPNLQDPAGLNFVPSADSIAVGANQKHAAYETFEELYGLDIYVDRNGQPRTRQTIGAFEPTA